MALFNVFNFLKLICAFSI